MTLLNMLEIVRQQFPDKGSTQVRIDLNSAYSLFSEETRLPFENLDITVVAGALSSGSDVLSASNGWHSLPSTVRDVITASAYDINANEVASLDYHIEYVGRRFAILDLNNFLFPGGGLPPGIVSLRFVCSVEPTALSVDADEPEYPEAFHQALVDHVLAKYYGYKGILQQSGWFKSSYQAQVQAAKRYFNRLVQ